MYQFLRSLTQHFRSQSLSLDKQGAFFLIRNWSYMMIYIQFLLDIKLSELRDTDTQFVQIIMHGIKPYNIHKHAKAKP